MIWLWRALGLAGFVILILGLAWLAEKIERKAKDR